MSHNGVKRPTSKLRFRASSERAAEPVGMRDAFPRLPLLISYSFPGNESRTWVDVAVSFASGKAKERVFHAEGNAALILKP